MHGRRHENGLGSGLTTRFASTRYQTQLESANLGLVVAYRQSGKGVASPASGMELVEARPGRFDIVFFLQESIQSGIMAISLMPPKDSASILE